MVHFEDLMFEKRPSCTRPSFYRRYVDDSNATVRSREQADEFLNFLNSLHPNTKYIVEYGALGKLSSSDLLIDKATETISSSIFPIKTFSCLGTNYFRYCDKLFKVNAFKTY